ncbi:MAG: hypothetical protein AB7O24_00835 [Kofleriaceae bacterium]
MSGRVGSNIDPVEKLLAEVVDSFEKLELLLRLYDDPSITHTMETIASQFSLPEEVTRDALSALSATGVVRSDDRGWQFDGSSPWASEVKDLAQLYETDRHAILKRLTELALARMRSRTARRFANAFMLRPRKPGDPDG